MDIKKLKQKYKDYNFDMQHKRDKIFMGIPIHFDKETGEYIKPPFWEEIRSEWKELSMEEYGYEPCGVFNSRNGTACQNKQEILEENDGVCLVHSTSKKMQKVPQRGTGYLYQLSLLSIQTCDACMLPQKEDSCPYFKPGNSCVYENEVYEDIVNKLKNYYGDIADPVLEVKIAQLAMNVVLNMRASLLLSRNMYVRDSRSTLEIHPAFKVFKDTTQKIDSYISSINKLMEGVASTEMNEHDKISYFTKKLTEEEEEYEEIDPDEIERMIREDIKKNQQNRITNNDIKDWKKIENLFGDEEE